MSSSDKPETSNTDTRTPAQDVSTRAQDNIPSSTPVEMNSLKADNRIGSPIEQQDTHESDHAHMPHRPMRTDTTTAILSAQNPPEPPLPSPPSPQLNRTVSTAIGPSTESPSPLSKDVEDAAAGPTLMITLLLISGARHPYVLNAKYLSKRNVQVHDDDPFNLSVYKVKELILREWRDEWEAKPSSPSAIRLIHFGKILDDKAAIKDLKFNTTSTNVVHMSLKPQDYVDEEDAKGAKASRVHSRDGDEGRSPGCRCVIM